MIPHWAKEPKSKCSTINARAETFTEKPAYRAAFRHRRYLIPVDGFYEWSLMADGKSKQPWYIALKDGEPFAFAGLWERWEPTEGQEGEAVELCTFIVTDANALLQRIHSPTLIRRPTTPGSTPRHTTRYPYRITQSL